MDHAPLLADGLRPEPTDAIEASLPSESYLSKETIIMDTTWETRKEKVIACWAITYQDFNLFASGKSGFTNIELLDNVDNDTPATVCTKEYVKNRFFVYFLLNLHNS